MAGPGSLTVSGFGEMAYVTTIIIIVAILCLTWGRH